MIHSFYIYVWRWKIEKKIGSDGKWTVGVQYAFWVGLYFPLINVIQPGLLPGRETDADPTSCRIQKSAKRQSPNF